MASVLTILLIIFLIIAVYFLQQKLVEELLKNRDALLEQTKLTLSLRNRIDNIEKQAIMFRVYRQSPKQQIMRLLTYAKQVRHRVDVWLAYNIKDKDVDEAVIYTLMKECKNICYTFFYSDKSLYVAFPTLERAKDKVKDGGMPLTWSSHAEAIGVWFSLYPDYEYTWVIEADAGWAGDLNTFLDEFSNVTSDLLMATKELPPAGWPHLGQCTKKFMDLVNITQGGNSRYISKETVGRYSRKLLRKSQEIMHQGGHAWSEQFYINVCREPDCTYFDLDRADIFKTPKKRYFNWNVRIDCNSWPNWVNKTDNHWFHALKKC